MIKMTSRERMLAAARHEPVDRIPLMLWIEPHTLVRIATEVRPPRNPLLRAFFNGLKTLGETLPTEELRGGVSLLAHPVQNDFLLELGSDCAELIYGFPPLWIKGVRFTGGRLVIKDMYDIERGIGGQYLESIGYPCKTPEDLDRCRFPDLTSPIHYGHVAAYRRARPDAAIRVWCPGVQDWGQSWMGMENLYMWMVDRPEIMERFFRRLAEHTLEIIHGALRAGADIVTINDDYGTSRSLLMSKKMWERFTFPCLRRQCDEIHRRGGVSMLHSCGHVMPLLDKIAEAGVDMLHPLQESAGNDLAAAKSEFGGRLCFVTGIDAQLLPTATPEETRESILAAARTGAEGGGFVLCTTNFLQQDTPVENITAMFKTIEEVLKGRL
jgi:uroporphyrinogen decarboxylase